MTLKIADNIFRQYDIRGRFGTELSLEMTRALGRGYAKFLKHKTEQETGKVPDKRLKVSIGRDVRLSSTELRDALILGITESDIDCVDLGECPTPLQYFSLHTVALDGGIMITGSHNPPEYNGFKISVGKETIHGEEIQELKGYVIEAAAAINEELGGKGQTETYDIISSYIEYHTNRFKDTIRPSAAHKPLKVVLDAGNGTGGLVAPELLRKLGCEVVELYCEVDGNFPNHHPDPTVEENLVDLIKTVKEENADFGIGYDGDSDRIGVVDERGSVIWGDLLMVIFARDIIAVQPKATVVGEVKCSQVLYDEVARLGGKAIMWKTGHSLIKSQMKKLGAALAGEMSGHIFFADRYFGFDDAVYASCRLLEILAARRESKEDFAFSELLSGLQETVVTPEIRVECPDDLKFEVIENLKKSIDTSSDGEVRIKEVLDIDGLRIVFEGGWALIRTSNTQPVLSLRFEAENAKLLEKFKAYVQTEIAKVWDGAATLYD
jgi:phosphomannomutase/phosphoglucomutase